MVNMAVSCLLKFSLGSHNSKVFTLGDKRTTLPRPEIYPQNLSKQYLVVWGSKKNSQGGGGIIQISQKGKLF